MPWYREGAEGVPASSRGYRLMPWPGPQLLSGLPLVRWRTEAEPPLDRPKGLGEGLAARPPLNILLQYSALRLVDDRVPLLPKAKDNDAVASIEAGEALGHGDFNARARNWCRQRGRPRGAATAMQALLSAEMEIRPA